MTASIQAEEEVLSLKYPEETSMPTVLKMMPLTQTEVSKSAVEM